MKIPPIPHRWNISPAQAVRIQRKFALQIIKTASLRPIHWITGLDAAFSPDGTTCIGVAVTWDVDQRKVIEQSVANSPLAFPYIPGFLSFREAPALLAALKKLKRVPDALMCDGQGIAHPRRFGIACHMGILAGLPAIGCAKSLLVGDFCEPGSRRGSASPLMDRGERIGTVLRTRDDVKAVFVSIGHMMSLQRAEEIVLTCALQHRLPEPTRFADALSKQARQGIACLTLCKV